MTPAVDPRERVTLIITITVCVFLLISLIGAYALAWSGRDPGEIWGKVFDLVQILTGAIVGYAAGQYTNVRSTTTNTAPPAPTVYDEEE